MFSTTAWLRLHIRGGWLQPRELSSEDVMVIIHNRVDQVGILDTLTGKADDVMVTVISASSLDLDNQRKVTMAVVIGAMGSMCSA